jgi:hypothetical protein
MKKIILALVALALLGCGMTPKEIKAHPTKSFETNKSQSEFISCLVPRLDERTFNGTNINTITKPMPGGISLSPIQGNLEFIDITTENSKTHIIYYGEATKRPFMEKTRINEVFEDIEFCL